MTLKEYIQQFPRLQRGAIRKWIAAQLGISEVYVRSMYSGNKSIPAKYAIKIEKITAGQVKKHMIAPDFYPIDNNN